MTATIQAPAEHLVRQINTLAREHFALVKRSIQTALELGGLLVAAKAEVAHGEWFAWIKANLTITERTAQRYMSLSRQWPDIERRLGPGAYSLTSVAKALRFCEELEAAEAIEAETPHVTTAESQPVPIEQPSHEQKRPQPAPSRTVPPSSAEPSTIASSTKEVGVALPLLLHQHLESIAMMERRPLKAVVETALWKYAEQKGFQRNQA